MEGFLTIILIGIFVVTIYSVDSRPSRRSRTSRDTSPPLAPWSKRHPAPSSKAGVFDGGTAHHVNRPQQVSGAAYVTDGDTIRIGKIQIRLFGIDAPELDHPYGKKAKWALHSMCKGHTIKADITDRDDYGRTVARCYLPDGRDLSAEMVKLGLAIDWPKYSGGTYRTLETPDARRKLFLADARQKGRMDVWERYKARQTKA